MRVAYTLTEIQENLGRIRLTLLLGVALYALLIVGLTVWLAGSIVRPIEELNRGAKRIAGGDLDHRVHVNGTAEITHLADTLNYTAQRLQQLENIRRQFVSNVSHELRTPLAAIRSMAETLMQHGEKDPALRTCAPAANAKGVKVITDIPPALPELRGDRDRLVQVFINLLDNAIRHTGSGGQITITARPQPNALTVTIADTGEGIPPEHLPHIFERFYRVDKARSRRSGGTGLGLSIVQQIVQAHGGSIAVESAVGQGTRFTMMLPLTEPPFLPPKT